MREIRREGRKIVLSFAHVGNGLFLKGDKVNALIIDDGEQAIDYSAVVSGEEVAVTLSGDVSGIITVKFARNAWYQVNLYNQAGIPAIPFEAVC